MREPPASDVERRSRCASRVSSSPPLMRRAGIGTVLMSEMVAKASPGLIPPPVLDEYVSSGSSVRRRFLSAARRPVSRGPDRRCQEASNGLRPIHPAPKGAGEAVLVETEGLGCDLVD